MSGTDDWLRRQLSSASSEVERWDPQKRDTLRSEVSTRLRGVRAERGEIRETGRTGNDPKPPRG